MTRPIPEGVVPPDKDALIREMVTALEGIRSTSTYGLSFALYSATVRDQCKNALTLARTTCPEAFDGCNETPADGR